MSAKKKNNQIALVSIVVPAYKQEKTIKDNLLQIKEVLEQIRFPYEIICVVDGKVDKTYQNAQAAASKFPNKIKVIGYKKNLGKGHAVRFGMAQAKGNIIGFVDAGLDLEPNGLSMLLEHFKWYNADIIIGSKRHPVSKVKYPWQRKILSFGYQVLVKLLFGLNVKDTQVGMKFFRREVLEDTMPRLLVKAFAFDIEMLAVANYLGYKRIFEAPVELEHKFSASTITKAGFIKTVRNMLWDTMAVFYRLRLLHYYDDKNKDNWIAPEYLTLNGS